MSKQSMQRKSEMLLKSATEKILKGKKTLNIEAIPKNVIMQLGSLMVFLMINSTVVKNSLGNNVYMITLDYVKSEPGKRQSVKQVGVCRIQEEFIRGIIDAIERKDSMFIQLERSLPMMYKPAPWIDYEVGGYYQKPTQVMRV